MTKQLYPKECPRESCVLHILQTTYTRIITRTFFKMTRYWEKLICQGTEWINKLWQIPSMEYYTRIKMNNAQAHIKIQVNLTNIILM